MQWYFLSDRQEQVPLTEQQMPALVANGHIKPHTMLWHEGLADWAPAGQLKPEIFPQVAPQQRTAQAAPVYPQPQRQAQQPQQRSPYAAPVQSAPVYATGGGGAGGQMLVKDLAYPIARSSGWMKLISVLGMLGGIAGLFACCYLLAVTIGAMGAKDPTLRQGAGVFLIFVITALIVTCVLLYQAILLFRGSTKLRVALESGQREELYNGLNDVGGYFKIQGIITLLSLIFAIVALALYATLLLSIVNEVKHNTRSGARTTQPIP